MTSLHVCRVCDYCLFGLKMGIHLKNQVWKIGVKNDFFVFLSEIGSVFGELDGTPPPGIPWSSPTTTTTRSFQYLEGDFL